MSLFSIATGRLFRHASCLALAGLLVLAAFITEASAQSDEPAYLTRRPLNTREQSQVWDEWIPSLGRTNGDLQDATRGRLVRIGLPVVKHLVRASQTPSLMTDLESHGQLLGFKDVIHTELVDWFADFAGQFHQPAPIVVGFNNLRNARTDAEVKAAVQAVWRHVDANEPDVDTPEVLNTIRGQAVLAIGEAGDPSALPVVRDRLGDISHTVVMYAIEAMGLLHATHADQATIYPYLFDADLAIRTRAQHTLRVMDARESVYDLMQALAGEPTPQETIFIVQALEAITAQSHGYDLARWQAWWGNVGTGPNPLGLAEVTRTSRWGQDGDAEETED